MEQSAREPPIVRSRADDGRTVGGAPLRPRARVETSPPETSVLHGQKIVAGTDPRPAVGDHFTGVGHPQGGIALPKLVDAAKPSVGTEVVDEGGTSRSGYVARSGIDRFSVAPVALDAPGVEEDSPVNPGLEGPPMKMLFPLRRRPIPS